MEKGIHQTDARLVGFSSTSSDELTAEMPNVLETPPEGEGHVLCKTSERESHRMDLKDAAFVKMRDSVSFYKKILMSMYLKKHNCEHRALYTFDAGPCAEGMHVMLASCPRVPLLELHFNTVSSSQSAMSLDSYSSKATQYHSSSACLRFP